MAQDEQTAANQELTWFLRGCPGLEAGEESDPCGAGQEQPDRRQGDPAFTICAGEGHHKRSVRVNCQSSQVGSDA
jgi:hypothetical protein